MYFIQLNTAVHICVYVIFILKSDSTINSLMFAGINVCVFGTKPCSRGLIFAVSLGLISCLGT